MRRADVRGWLWRLTLTPVLAVALVSDASAVARAQAQSQAPAQAGADNALQVTLFAIVATPGTETLDPKLAWIEPQLRKLLPGHGFKLIEVNSKRLRQGESVRCDLGNGRTASTSLVRMVDDNGKVEMHCALRLNDMVEFETRVATPPNQLFFCDRLLENGSRLLIGVGAR